MKNWEREREREREREILKSWMSSEIKKKKIKKMEPKKT